MLTFINVIYILAIIILLLIINSWFMVLPKLRVKQTEYQTFTIQKRFFGVFWLDTDFRISRNHITDATKSDTLLAIECINSFTERENNRKNFPKIHYV